MHPLRECIKGLRGWRRNLFAFMLGVFATLALPPVFAFPLLIVSFTGLFLLVDAAPSRKQVFWDGWWWGWGFYISGLYWFCIALLTEPDKFAWLIPFALFALTGVIAVYAGIACWLASLPRIRGMVKLFVFSVIWTFVEFARGYLFTGFPWNLPGYSFAFSDATLQMASLVGAYGLTWLAVWLGTVPAALASDLPKRKTVTVVILSYVVFVLGTGWGAWRLEMAERVPDGERFVPGVTLRLVQAGIAQHHKWDPKLQMQGLQEHIRLTHAPGLDKITHVIWPETAVPYALKPDTPLTRMLGKAIPPGKFLIVGALRVQEENKDWQLWNSIMALDSTGAIISAYDKSKLVPFGEFLPFRPWLPEALVTPVGMKDFAKGKGPQTLTWPGLPPVSPLICYEAIFPELAVDPGQRPQWLLNVTNDAWFGMSSGPHQHFQMARMRAVEQGVPLVRVANTGITAAIDPYGRIVSRLDLGSSGILDIRLPKPLPGGTAYLLFRDRFLLLLAFATAILIILQQRGQKN